MYVNSQTFIVCEFLYTTHVMNYMNRDKFTTDIIWSYLLLVYIQICRLYLLDSTFGVLLKMEDNGSVK